MCPNEDVRSMSARNRRHRWTNEYPPSTFTPSSRIHSKGGNPIHRHTRTKSISNNQAYLLMNHKANYSNRTPLERLFQHTNQCPSSALRKQRRLPNKSPPHIQSSPFYNLLSHLTKSHLDLGPRTLFHNSKPNYLPRPQRDLDTYIPHGTRTIYL